MHRRWVGPEQTTQGLLFGIGSCRPTRKPGGARRSAVTFPSRNRRGRGSSAERRSSQAVAGTDTGTGETVRSELKQSTTEHNLTLNMVQISVLGRSKQEHATGPQLKGLVRFRATGRHHLMLLDRWVRKQTEHMRKQEQRQTSTTALVPGCRWPSHWRQTGAMTPWCLGWWHRHHPRLTGRKQATQASIRTTGGCTCVVQM